LVFTYNQLNEMIKKFFLRLWKWIKSFFCKKDNNKPVLTITIVSLLLITSALSQRPPNLQSYLYLIHPTIESEYIIHEHNYDVVFNDDSLIVTRGDSLKLKIISSDGYLSIIPQNITYFDTTLNAFVTDTIDTFTISYEYINWSYNIVLYQPVIDTVDVIMCDSTVLHNKMSNLNGDEAVGSADFLIFANPNNYGSVGLKYFDLHDITFDGSCNGADYLILVQPTQYSTTWHNPIY